MIQVSGLALGLLFLSWAAIGQLTWVLWLLSIGIVALDSAVRAVHVSNQHALTTTHPERISSVIGSHMVFYSLGSPLGAAATTALFASHGWGELPGCCSRRSSAPSFDGRTAARTTEPGSGLAGGRSHCPGVPFTLG